MEHFNTLIDQQQAIGAEIERIISNFKKDPASRKTNRYYQDRILRLTEQWSRLEKNHNTLLSCKAMAEDTEDEYFTTGYYERMTELTNKYLGIFNKALIEMQEVENAQEKPPRQHNQNPMQLQQNEELSRVLRNQRALINVIDRSSQEIEMASQESQNEVFYSCKLALIEGYHKAFDNNNEKIWNSTSEEFIEGYSWELYYEISQKLQDMEICLKLKLKSFNSHYQHDSTIQAVKLPQLTIPIFDGNQLKWVEFRDLFTQLIDEQPFKPIQKMFYLTTNLIGEPKNLIKHLPASAENYITAWEILKARYNNGRLLVTALLNKLFALPAMTTETASGLKTLHDISQECLLGLKAQNIPVEHWDVIIVHMTLKKLDKITQTAFEQSLSNNRELITMKELFQFIEQRFQSLETINNSASIKKWVKTVATTNTAPVKCPICKRDNHPIHLCKQFLDDTPAKRLHLIKSLQRCFNCLKNGHFTKDCTSGSCLKCSKKHNTLLHLEGTLEASMIKKASLSKNPASLFSNNLNIQKNYVVLGTARVVVKGNNGREIECRALLDSGSQVNLITDQIIKKLGENPKKTSACIEGVGQKKQDAQQRINLAFSSRINGFSSRIEAYVLPKIVCDQPSIHIESSSWKIPQNINLADPSFNTPNKIDLLLGAEFSHQLLSIGQINLGRGLPILQNTLLGWLVVGKISNQNSIISPQVCGICSEDEQDTMKVIERFWQLDEPEKANKNLSPSEELCESHFATYMKRNQDGRFSVRLPFKQDPSLLGESKHIAINRFLALERRLDKDVILKTQYVQFMNEYADLGHMERVDINQVNPHYVIPHHGVLRPDSSTTKLRVVFDASCKTSSGLSLNDTMFTGPTIQEELFAILLRFRCPRFVFCSDIQKMYRQIIIQPEDQRYQLIVWRSNNNEPLQFYRLKTVTYGTRSAPYLATKCLQQLAKSELQKYPLGAAALSNDFYVDDCLSGSNSLQTAKDIQTQLKGLLESAGFKLRKWCANHPSLLQNIAKEDQEVDLDFQSDDATSIKTLGLTWQPKEDQFRIKLKLDPLKIITKRTITSNLAKIFDPLGLLGPVLVTAKILIQDLWQLQLTWDEAVPTEIYTRWTTFYDDLQVLDQFKIDRHIFGKQMPALESIQLHVFCDASQKAYGAAVYVRAKLMDGRLINRLLCSKSRVAPLKKQTIPRLELCSALLGATLMKKVKNNINHDVATYYWTDSEIVLFWINSSSARHQQFIANRINAIQEISLPNQWRHVRSKDNPADSLSRGIKPAQLLENNLWLYGPLFLHGSESNWPGKFNKTLCIDPVNPEWKQTTREVALISTDYDIHWIDRINHRNSFRTLLHTVGYMLRFVNRARRTNLSNITMALSPMELELSLRHIVKYIQQSELKEELIQLERNQTVKPASTLAGLMPFLDEHKIIRVGGRLEASSLTYDEKHQIVLPYNNPIVKLIMKDIHERNMHCGGQALLAAARQKFWPIKGKIMARSTIHHCVRCTRCKPVTFEQVMGSLPRHRVQPNRPFFNTGVDFCGPFWVHYKVRGKRPHKAYLAVYCCFATKAVHLELVSDLTTEAFIGSLKRFIARRGCCQNIYCDNATNFVGASNKLQELTTTIHSNVAQEQITKTCSNKGIAFHFIPPRAPHFDGLWEAAVKSAKYLLVRSVSTETLTYEELETVIIEIEAILNSRPLTPMSSNPNDLQALTPGHFLVGDALTAPVDATCEKVKSSLLNRWNLVAHLKQEFWKRWRAEYLMELQVRNKWREECKNIEENTLVILKEDNVQPLQWPLGRIMKTYKGNDGFIRVVDVKTATGMLKRPIHKLAPLFPENKPIKTQENRHNKEERMDNEIVPRKQRRVSSNIKLTTVLISLLLLPIVLCSPVNVTELRSAPGIHFEQVGTTKLITSHWKMIIYYDLAPFNTELDILKDSTLNLLKLCDQSNLNSTCKFVVHHFQQAESELRTAFEFMSSARNKRGAIDLVGNIASSLFGVLDSNYASDMSKTIKTLEDHDDKLKHLLKNQISIIDSTINVIKKNQISLKNNFQGIETQLNAISKRLVKDEHDQLYGNIINMLSIQMTIATINLQRTQSTIMDVLIDSHHEKINPLLITPQQLITEGEKIRAHLPSHLQFPVEQDDILTLYKLMQVTGQVSSDHVIFNIMIPLVERKTFEIFHVVPVISSATKVLTSIKPSTEYLAINSHKDEYFPITKLALQSCITTEEDSYLCSNVQSIYRRGANVCKCEINLYNNGTGDECEIVELKETTIWTQLKHKNHWIYATKYPMQLNAVCGSNAFPVILNSTGMVKIASNCVIRDNTVLIQGHQVITSLLKSAYTSIGISTPEIKPSKRINNSEIEYLPQLRELTILQKQLTKDTLPELSSKVQQTEKHSLSVGYAALFLIIGIIILKITKLIRNNQTPGQPNVQTPQPLPRSRSTFDITTT